MRPVHAHGASGSLSPPSSKLSTKNLWIFQIGKLHPAHQNSKNSKSSTRKGLSLQVCSLGRSRPSALHLLNGTPQRFMKKSHGLCRPLATLIHPYSDIEKIKSSHPHYNQITHTNNCSTRAGVFCVLKVLVLFYQHTGYWGAHRPLSLLLQYRQHIVLHHLQSDSFADPKELPQ